MEYEDGVESCMVGREKLGGGKDAMIWIGGNSREGKKGEDESGERGEDSGKEVDDVWRGGKDVRMEQ